MGNASTYLVTTPLPEPKLHCLAVQCPKTSIQHGTEYARSHERLMRSIMVSMYLTPHNDPVLHYYRYKLGLAGHPLRLGP